MAKGRLILVVALVVALAAAFLVWRADRRADAAERQAGLASARTLSEVFDKTAALQVSRLRGEAIAQSRTEGCLGLCTVTQSTRAPYSVVYTVDLRNLPQRAYRWNGDSRTMIVTIPVVRVGSPNVDFSRAEINQGGLWISRQSNVDLQAAAAKSLRLATKAAAEKPENMVKAQEAAREAVQALVEGPLRAAGLDDVNVMVQLPGETRPAGLDRERWDESRPLAEVLSEAR